MQQAENSKEDHRRGERARKSTRCQERRIGRSPVEKGREFWSTTFTGGRADKEAPGPLARLPVGSGRGGAPADQTYGL
jgi:hypothetical protein